ncbi:ATP-binding response regulator [Thioflexithrix psekupsensis]|uniref:histidine kinase n=1 Tax=Thioflexithrix psekupsensis TaxID=1570016 RepID=A0A251X631_9GAMM|nr:hybrid sensor histidine kinase/response regulator [Thioflexithrix psekupsensis]OUD12602.1 hybrid sensor histidine kinase/response regulator [Thioflexithrix psekupsensis]
MILDTLLVVDDTPENVTVLLNMLSKAGFDVLVAREGEEGIQTAEYANPDMILLDIMMPDMDGFQVCQRLKSNPATADIPVIFMTALTDTTDKVKGFQVGASDYITKPLQHEEVLARIRAHLNAHKLQQRLYERNMELDAFAHTVAHDLKDPISAMTCLAETLFLKSPEGTVVDARMRERLQLIGQAGRQTINIIDALLLLAGVSQQKTVEYHVLNMQEIVASVLTQRLQTMLEKYQAEISYCGEWPAALGYAPWIEEVWFNYLHNGLKYGGTPPRLQVGAETCRGQRVRFWVRDNGRGLTVEEQRQLFTPFMRLHTDAVEGHGLGLSIVGQIIKKLGGEVGVKSQLGEGSLFYFTLPAA